MLHVYQVASQTLIPIPFCLLTQKRIEGDLLGISLIPLKVEAINSRRSFTLGGLK
jgi:hypothetical protein